MGGAIFGLTVQRRGEEFRDALVVDRARLARAQLVMQALDAAGDEAPAPLAHRRVGGAEAARHRAVGRASGARENDVRAAHNRRRQRMRTRDRLQLRLLTLAQNEFRFRSTHRHRGISISKDTPMSYDACVSN
jgi:hypothetical protein